MAFCSQCGSGVSNEASFCGQCGSQIDDGQAATVAAVDEGSTTPAVTIAYASQDLPFSDNDPVAMAAVQQYCSSCGNSVDPRAVVCPGCGVATAGSVGAKSKTAAVLLAVFLGPWTWLYTYTRDFRKFWAGIGVSIGWTILLIIAITAFSSTVAACTTTQLTTTGSCAALTAGTAAAGFGFASVATIISWILFPAIWIWSIVDTASRRDWFYTNYPNG